MFISATTVLVAVDVFLKIKNAYSWEDDTLVHNHILEADSKTNYKFSQWMNDEWLILTCKFRLRSCIWYYQDELFATLLCMLELIPHNCGIT